MNTYNFIFSLDPDSGLLTMKGGTREGVYNFHVSVYDRVWRRSVVSTVTVTVEEIGDDAVFSSGSIRLSGNIGSILNYYKHEQIGTR